MLKRLPMFEASATLVGTIIGAGILGIPYAIAQIGFWPGVGIMVVIAAIMLLRHFIIAEMVLRTPHVHQMPGYAGIYLGKWPKRIDSFIVLLAGYGALLAYMIGQGEVLTTLLGGSEFQWSMVFYAFGIAMIYFGLSVIKRSELIMTVGIFLITLVIGIFSWNHIDTVHLTHFEPRNWILAYGVLLFAFGGSVAIPQMREVLAGKEHLMRRAIFIASGVVFSIYLVFTFLVLGVSGTGTTEIATIGLGEVIGQKMIIIGNLLAFFTMGTSFLTIGLGLKEVFAYDWHFTGIKAWLVTVIVPLIAFLIGARDFITVLGVVGGVLTGVQSLILIMSFWSARKSGWRKPEFSLGPMKVTGIILMFFFVFGAIMTLYNI